MRPDLAAAIARAAPTATDTAVWWHGLAQLRCVAYLADVLPPDDLITSVRCLVLHDSTVLVVRNADDTHLWPGGRREPGETPLVTLRREVSEETGWTVHEPLLLGFLHYHHETPKPLDYPYAYPDFCQAVYWAEADAFTPDTHDPDGYERESAFFPITDIRRGVRDAEPRYLWRGQLHYLVAALAEQNRRERT